MNASQSSARSLPQQRRRSQRVRLAVMVVAVVTLGGCSSLAMKLSCSDAPPQHTEIETFQVQLLVKQRGRTVVDEATISCQPMGQECTDGRLYTQWRSEPKRPRKLQVELTSGEVVAVKPPRCAALQWAAGTEDTNWQPWSRLTITADQETEHIYARPDLKAEVLTKHQIDHLGLRVIRLE